MALGLKRGVVELADHDPEWEQIARDTIGRLWRVFGSLAKEIQHIGSTAMVHIKAKPIIDIAVAVDDFDEVMRLIPALENEGFIHKSEIHDEWQVYFVCHDFENDIRTHNIHVVKSGGENWKDYLLFRDYLNNHPAKAHKYEVVKLELMAKNKNDRVAYCDGKTDFFMQAIREAKIYENFGRIFTRIELIKKGMSGDKKYYVETVNNERVLLRVSDMSEYDRKKAEYDRMMLMASAEVPMSRPVSFGICNDNKNVYQLLTWCDGENLETVLSLMSETEQYVTGLKAGEILRKIHSVPALTADTIIGSWHERYSGFIDESIKAFRESGVKADSSELLLQYFNNNRYLLNTRPSGYLHGDYHTGNMIYYDKNIAVIDWEIHLFGCYGDPWWEVLYYYINPYYSSGVVRGYFNDDPPKEFWKIYSIYAAVSAISSIPWAYYRCPSELDAKIKNCSDVVEWFDNMKNPVPTWYLKDFYIQWIDGVPYKLKTPFDFSFLNKYGKVFKVYDNQGSGNICFGVTDGDKRYFVKFAGAPTENYTGTAENAIERLKRAVPAYRDLEHPNLIKLIRDEAIGGGYAVVFDWVNALYMRASDGSQEFKDLPLKTHLKIFDEILSFHENMTKKGYYALDLYEDHIMWDVDNEKAVICDIDFYSKGWYEGMSGIWNTDCEWYFPEQFIDGAKFDEVSCVYIMGATAFALFGDGRDRCIEKWKLSKGLFDIAKKAVSDKREDRQQSMEQLIAEWRAVK